MTEALSIDIVGSDEAELFLRVMRVAFESLRGRLDPPSGSHTETLDSVRASLAAAGGFLARIGDEVVGCARWRLEPDHLYAGRVGVLSGFRGRRVGAALMAAIEDAARSANRSQVQVEVRAHLDDNVRFYERLGYRRLSLTPHPRGPDKVLRMVKDVTSGSDGR